jgi:rare lipoprotein A
MGVVRASERDNRRDPELKSKYRFVALAAAFVTAGAVYSVGTQTAEAGTQCGRASWYKLGGRTASGERNNPSAMTAAHRSLPFGTRVRVENLKNGKYVVVRINDRGPFVGGRVIDVSKAAAEQLGMMRSGTASVRIVADGRELRGACRA